MLLSSDEVPGGWLYLLRCPPVLSISRNLPWLDSTTRLPLLNIIWVPPLRWDPRGSTPTQGGLRRSTRGGAAGRSNHVWVWGENRKGMASLSKIGYIHSSITQIWHQILEQLQESLPASRLEGLKLDVRGYALVVPQQLIITPVVSGLHRMLFAVHGFVSERWFLDLFGFVSFQPIFLIPASASLQLLS